MKARKIALLVLLLVLSAMPVSASVAVFTVGSNVYAIDGQQFSMDAAPQVVGGRTFVPVRYVAQAVGVDPKDILYDGGKVTLIRGDRVVQLTVGSNVMVKNGAPIVMDMAPEVVNGRVMLPLRWVAQALDAGVEWNGNTRQVTISFPDSLPSKAVAITPPVGEADIEDVTTPSIIGAIREGKIPPLYVRPRAPVGPERRPEVVGNSYFRETVNEALNLLYERDRENYYLVCYYLPKVEEAPASFVAIVDGQAQTFFFNLPQDYPKEAAVYYTLGGLVHEAAHTWLAEKGYQTTGEAGEYFATAVHTRSLLKVGAPSWMVKDPDEAIKARWWERPEQPVRAVQ